AAEVLERSASRRTSSATTARPRPPSPARAAPIAALRASRLVWSAMSLIRRRSASMSLTRPARARVLSLDVCMSASACSRLSLVAAVCRATPSTVSAMAAEARTSSSVVADARRETLEGSGHPTSEPEGEPEGEGRAKGHQEDGTGPLALDPGQNDAGLVLGDDDPAEILHVVEPTDDGMAVEVGEGCGPRL